MTVRKLLVAILLSCSAAAYADPDAEGCKDLPVLKRYPGTTISSCEMKEYDEPDVPVSWNQDQGFVTKKMGGKLIHDDYTMPETLSNVQVGRNIENALTKAGFKILVGTKAPTDCCTITGQLKNVVVTATVGGGAITLMQIDLQELEQKMDADASALLDELNKSGHVAVYGINFDTGKATITSDSDKVLQQVQKLLADNGDLRLRIEGHTDNVGKAQANLDLSKKRAAAVKEWLVKNGIDASRLETQGLGSSKPAADNSTDEGKAKNRRVELVKL